MIYSFKSHIPVVHESSFVHPLAAVTGNVIIGENCYIGPGAAIRGDWGEIILEKWCECARKLYRAYVSWKIYCFKNKELMWVMAQLYMGLILGRNTMVGYE